ncbi:MAG: uncharacterized protein K0S79_1294 [Nitrospira sp.]|jgi:hypothetical protein|nr:uncharacterized protein [Nitrospira sp.]
MATTNVLKILGVAGPFREPREPAFSYDYSIQRPHWPMPHAVRVKVAIAEELDVLRGKILGPVSGSPGQQLLVSQLLTRKIADEKIRIADQDGLLSGRADVVVPPFAGPLAHLFARLESWLDQQGEAVRIEIKERVKI